MQCQYPAIIFSSVNVSKKKGTDFAVKNTLPENSQVISVNFGYEVGRFIFDFLENDTSWPETIPDDIPESCICIETRIINLPWLLSKKDGSADRLYIEETRRIFENILKQLNIEYSVMSHKEVSAYMKQWFLEYLPPTSDKKEMESVCLFSKEHSTLLWHMFTWGKVESEEGEHANECFDEKEKGECVILLENHKFGFILKNGDGLTSKILDPYKDIYVTAKDFSWSYVHTHEDGWIGPFFYHRGVQKQE